MSKIPAAVAATAAVVLLAGCGQVGDELLGNPNATPPARARVAAGPALAAATAYFRDHLVVVPKGMQEGILVRVQKLGALCALNGCTWQAVVVVPGGWTENLSSDSGDDGMASFIAPGDLFEFPARSAPVDAPGDNYVTGTPAKLLQVDALPIGGQS